MKENIAKKTAEKLGFNRKLKAKKNFVDCPYSLSNPELISEFIKGVFRAMGKI